MNSTKINENNLILDLFMLHDVKIDDRPRKWIVAKGKDLKKEIQRLIKIINNNGINNVSLVKHLMRRFNISITSAERLVYLKKEWFPLVFIEEVMILARKEDERFKIQDKIELLKANQPPLKIYSAVKKLSIDLCKLVGAFAADGTLYDNLFRITENKKVTIRAFKKIIDNEFGINSKMVKIKKSKEEWGIEFHSKVIARYYGVLWFSKWI